jgi:hypothetical protein
MKSKFLPVLLVILILLNGVLVFILIKKTHQKKVNHPERNFLTEQLKFSENQKEKFIMLDELHKQNMESLSYQLKKQKDILFNSFGKDQIDIDSLVNITGGIESQKDFEVFSFFKSVREICTTEQQQKFDVIINKAIKGGQQGPPRNGGNHPPIEGGMPPPR